MIQTGSGKTHTMLGDIGDFENRGMTPRVFEYLFARIRKVIIQLHLELLLPLHRPSDASNL